MYHYKVLEISNDAVLLEGDFLTTFYIEGIENNEYKWKSYEGKCWVSKKKKINRG